MRLKIRNECPCFPSSPPPLWVEGLNSDDRVVLSETSKSLKSNFGRKTSTVKLKCLPEDFQVEEQTRFQASGGSFALYRLTKRSLGTPEAIDQVLRHWKLQRQQVSYGGLKDKHALTTQFLTIFRGPRRDLREESWELTYLGQAAQPFTPADISGNRFELVLRDLQAAETEVVLQAVKDVTDNGFPNYFDDQRFGSLGESGEFVARAWCQGDYERAVWLALAEPNTHDRPDDKRGKLTLRQHWGDWPTCQAKLGRSHLRSIVTYLVDHPTDFRGAIARIRADLRGLYLSSFQSALWNQLLASWLRNACSPEQFVEIPLRIGRVPFFRELNPEQREALRSQLLPLPTARNQLEPGLICDMLDEILKPYGMEQREIRVKYPRDSFFSKGERAAVVTLKKVQSQTSPDELYPGKHKVRLGFELPRGSYATILVKRLTECGGLEHSREVRESENDWAEEGDS